MDKIKKEQAEKLQANKTRFNNGSRRNQNKISGNIAAIENKIQRQSPQSKPAKPALTPSRGFCYFFSKVTPYHL